MRTREYLKIFQSLLLATFSRIVARRFMMLSAIAMVFVVGGCNTYTVVESTPAGRTSNCDIELVGTWIQMDDPEDAYYITPDCKVLEADDKRPVEDLEGLRFSYTVTSKNSYLTARGQIPFKEDSEPAWATGHYIFRYVLKDDVLNVYGINNLTLGKLIKNGKIPGRTQVKQNGEPFLDIGGTNEKYDLWSTVEYNELGEEYDIWNFVRGSSEDITEVLDTHEIFHQNPTWRFKRISKRTFIEGTPTSLPAVREWK